MPFIYFPLHLDIKYFIISELHTFEGDYCLAIIYSIILFQMTCAIWLDRNGLFLPLALFTHVP